MELCELFVQAGALSSVQVPLRPDPQCPIVPGRSVRRPEFWRRSATFRLLTSAFLQPPKHQTDSRPVSVCVCVHSLSYETPIPGSCFEPPVNTTPAILSAKYRPPVRCGPAPRPRLGPGGAPGPDSSILWSVLWFRCGESGSHSFPRVSAAELALAANADVVETVNRRFNGTTGGP